MAPKPIGLTAEQNAEITRIGNGLMADMDADIGDRAYADASRALDQMEFEHRLDERIQLSAQAMNEKLDSQIQASVKAPQFDIPLEAMPRQMLANSSLSGMTLTDEYMNAGAAAMAHSKTLAGRMGMTDAQLADQVRQNQAANGWKDSQIVTGLQDFAHDATVGFANVVAGTVDGAVQTAAQVADLAELQLAMEYNLFSDEPYQLTGFSRLANRSIAGESGESIWREGLGSSSLGAVGLGAYDLTTGAMAGDELQALSGGVVLASAFLAGRPSPIGARTPVQLGEAGRFADLHLRRVTGDGLEPHHMPQVAVGFTSRSEGGALVLTAEEHRLTRTWGTAGAQVAQREAGLPFRQVLARDLRDIRSFSGSTYNPGMLDLTKYYRENFSELMRKPQ